MNITVSLSGEHRVTGSKKTEICRNLRNKFDDLIKSINDSSARMALANYSIISGGAITSILLNENVHDYDIYIANEDALNAIIEYYEGLSKGSSAVPYSVMNISKNAITLFGGVQIITRFYGNPEEIHKNFDYAHTVNYWDALSGELFLDQLALECTLKKTLIYRGSLYPVSSIYRAKKFIERGWGINYGQYLKMCVQVSQLDLTNLEVLDDQLTGVSEDFCEYLNTKICRYSGSDKANVILSIIGEVFE